MAHSPASGTPDATTPMTCLGCHAPSDRTARPSASDVTPARLGTDANLPRMSRFAGLWGQGKTALDVTLPCLGCHASPDSGGKGKLPWMSRFPASDVTLRRTLGARENCLGCHASLPRMSRFQGKTAPDVTLPCPGCHASPDSAPDVTLPCPGCHASLPRMSRFPAPDVTLPYLKTTCPNAPLPQYPKGVWGSGGRQEFRCGSILSSPCEPRTSRNSNACKEGIIYVITQGQSGIQFCRLEAGGGSPPRQTTAQDVDGRIGVGIHPQLTGPALKYLARPAASVRHVAPAAGYRGIPGVHLNQYPTGPCCLVTQLLTYHSPSLPQYLPVQATLGPDVGSRVFQRPLCRGGHIPDLQGLDAYMPKTPDDARGNQVALDSCCGFAGGRGHWPQSGCAL